ncbi:hypothetical protein CYY_000133 [Polysphondylium violaceum]|uniref:HotDog ACOT-type domain-containing protein n=1 Tax=Polysphondylium violaceum TaxID=133409 RepID=A0A8J4V5W8_9MYCE|nr:hypothetical protein CYY_000133 [Polysphondylium violaceum]
MLNTLINPATTTVTTTLSNKEMNRSYQRLLNLSRNISRSPNNYPVYIHQQQSSSSSSAPHSFIKSNNVNSSVVKVTALPPSSPSSSSPSSTSSSFTDVGKRYYSVDTSSNTKNTDHQSTFEEITDFKNTIEIKNLPSVITKNDIQIVFKDYSIANHGIKMVFDDDVGFAYITFNNKKDYNRAVGQKSFPFSGQDYDIVPLQGTMLGSGVFTSQPGSQSYHNRSTIANHIWRQRGIVVGKPMEREPLETKTPSESKTEIDLLFSSDLALREMYLSPYGHLRVGRFLEDLDALAATTAIKHAQGEEDTSKMTIVTASVDRINLLKPLIPDRDIKMEGVVTYVGSSSMEVMIKVRSKDNQTQQWDPVLVAYFTMVARDPILRKAKQVNHLDCQTAREKKLFEDGKKHKAARLNFSQQSLENVPPTSSELQIIHNLFMISKTPNTLELLPMKETLCQSVILCQPQEKNINGNIFGGYLMRKGFELAFSTCFLKFNKSIPKFVAMDDISFLNSVDIGNILTLESTVVYSHPMTDAVQKYYAQVEVLAYVTEPLLGKRKLTNIFNFTFFCTPAGAVDPQQKVKQILPQTYSEAMRYLAGKRIVDRHRETESSPDHMEIWMD